MDVPAQAGREVPQRQGDDVGRRRREPEALRRQGIQRGPRPLLRCCRRLRPWPLHGGRPPQGAAGCVPVPAQPDDVPGDHPACVDRGQAGHVGGERHDRNRAVPAEAVRRQAERRARPPQRLLGRAPADGRCEDHVLPGQRASRTRPAGGTDRPGDAALATGGSAVQGQLEVHVLLAAGVRTQAVLHAGRRGSAPRPSCPPRGRPDDQPSAADRPGDARQRPGRKRQPVLEAVQVDRSVDRTASAKPPARTVAPERRWSAEPRLHRHDVELPRPHRPRRLGPGVRPPGGHRPRTRGHGRVEVLRLRAGRGGLRHHHSVAEPDRHPDGVRLARRAGPVHLAVLHVDGRLERLALQERRVRQGRQVLSRVP